MNIECWMVDENMWINAVPFMSQSSDKPITMEEWMTNSKYWANNVSK
jgi:hypothetical protein